MMGDWHWPPTLTLPSLQVVLGPDLPAAGGRDSDEAEPPGSLPDPGERELPRGVLRLCEVSSDPNTRRRVGKNRPLEHGGNDRPLEADDHLGVEGVRQLQGMALGSEDGRLTVSPPMQGRRVGHCSVSSKSPGEADMTRLQGESSRPPGWVSRLCSGQGPPCATQSRGWTLGPRCLGSHSSSAISCVILGKSLNLSVPVSSRIKRVIARSK